MPADDIDKTEPPRLAEMLSLDPAVSRAWRGDELSAILRHQLDAPLEFDLGDLSEDYAKLAPPDQTAGSLHWRVTFGQLLDHARPPLPLLERAKRFAKACRNHPDGPLPVEVATVLYFACIAVARLRCDGAPRISALDDAALFEGMSWALSQDWLDERTRALFAGAVEHLQRNQ